jgi:excinuclease UvrABC nuclease subunit
MALPLAILGLALLLLRRWRSVPLAARQRLPARPGVYVARGWFGLGGALYVGQSTNLRARWAGDRHHRLRDLPWHTRLYYRTCARGERRRRERELIRRLRPRLNGTRRRRRR